MAIQKLKNHCQINRIEEKITKTCLIKGITQSPQTELPIF